MSVVPSTFDAVSTMFDIYPATGYLPLVERTRAKTQELFRQLLDRRGIASVIEVKAFHPTAESGPIRYAVHALRRHKGMDLEQGSILYSPRTTTGPSIATWVELRSRRQATALSLQHSPQRPAASSPRSTAHSILNTTVGRPSSSSRGGATDRLTSTELRASWPLVRRLRSILIPRGRMLVRQGRGLRAFDGPCLRPDGAAVHAQLLRQQVDADAPLARACEGSPHVPEAQPESPTGSRDPAAVRSGRMIRQQRGVRAPPPHSPTAYRCRDACRDTPDLTAPNRPTRGILTA